jgi:Putative viral replication protein.
LDPLEFNDPFVKDFVYQLERGENGTLHFQGYVRFMKNRTLDQVVAMLDCDWENRRENHEVAFKYHTKEKTRVAGPWGCMSGVTAQGSRSDLVELRSFLYSCNDWSVVMRDVDHSDAVAKHMRWTKEVFAHKPVVPVRVDALFPWQSKLIDYLKGPVNDRKILWFYCKDGFSGKSYLGKLLQSNYGACVLGPDKKADVFHVYQQVKSRIVVFDLSRTASDVEHRTGDAFEKKVDYGFLYGTMEKLKDGCFMSGKYESCQVSCPSPHMVVLANQPPEESMVSRDRFEHCVFEIEGPEFDCDMRKLIAVGDGKDAAMKRIALANRIAVKKADGTKAFDDVMDDVVDPLEKLSEEIGEDQPSLDLVVRDDFDTASSVQKYNVTSLDYV